MWNAIQRNRLDVINDWRKEMNEEFKPYVSAEKVTPEFTVTSVIMGVLLAIVIWYRR